MFKNIADKIKEFFKGNDNNRKKHILRISYIATALIIIGAGTAVAVELTSPYALNEAGEKINQPWHVTIDGIPCCLLESEEAAQKLIDDIKNYYIEDGSEVREITVEEELAAVKAELEKGLTPPVCSNPDEILEYVMTGVEEKVVYTVKNGDTAWDIAADNDISVETLEKWNKGRDLEDLHAGDELKMYEIKPLVNITTVEKMTYTKKIKHKTKYIRSDKLYIGEKKTKKEGKDGKKTVTAVVKKVNGEVTDEDVLSSEVIEEPVKAVVYKGTKARGSAVVDYAMKFIGNPYVYGGTSLTNGTDCSGFTMSVYAHFGYSLPHNSYAQLNCGKAVSYSEAQPGDLIIYHNHVALYAGGGRIVHASSPGTGITTNSATYRTIIGVRRIIN